MAAESPKIRPELDTRRAGDLLEGWKAIGDYLNKTERTVQRWEKTKALPIRRLKPEQPDEQPRVFAYKSELDAWWQERLTTKTDKEEDDESGPEIPGLDLVQRGQDTETKPPRTKRLLYVLIIVALATIGIGTWYGFHIAQPKVVLAVVPFEGSTGDPEAQSIARGLTDEMISRIGRLRPARLGVIELTRADSGATPAQIGERFKADYVLQGFVQRGDQQVAITARLISVKEQGRVVWGFSDRSEMQQIIDFEVRVADAIVSGVLGVLPNASHPGQQVNRDAYEAYLTGRALWNRRTADSLRQAITYFQQAIKSEPKYAPAYAGLADCYSLLGSAPYTALTPKEAFPQAKAFAQQALQLDDTLAEAHLSLGYAELVYDWNYPQAEKEFRRALELRPGSATVHQYYAYYLTTMGDLDRAIEERKRAQELQPDSPLINSALGEAYYQARQYDLTIAQNQKSLVLDPSYAIALINLGRAYEQKGMYADALKIFQKAVAAAPDDPALLGLIGHSYAVSGNRSQALTVVQQLQQISTTRYVPSLYIALIYTGLGDRNEAFQWLDKAYNERCEYLVYLPVEPLADPLRADPRFPRFLKRLGLTAPKMPVAAARTQFVPGA